MTESTDKPFDLPQATDAPGMGANPAAPSSTPEEIKDRLTDYMRSTRDGQPRLPHPSARCDCGHPSSIHSLGVGGCNEHSCFCDGFNTVAQQRQTCRFPGETQELSSWDGVMSAGIPIPPGATPPPTFFPPMADPCSCRHTSSRHANGLGNCTASGCMCPAFTQPGSYGPYPTSQGVKGYRDLTPDEVALINVLKSEEEHIALLWGRIERDSRTDARWVNVARTHFQEGFSALIRSIAQPYDPFAAAFANNQQDEVEQVIPSRAPHLRDDAPRRTHSEPDYQQRYAGGDDT